MVGGPTPTKHPRQDGDEKLDHRPVKRPHLDYTRTNTISVLVGSEGEEFVVHKDAVCAKSKFFRSACSKNWKEGQEKIVRLPEVKAESFQRYVNWAYSDNLAAESTVDDSIYMMIQLYLLGDKLDDMGLRNKALKALHSYASIDDVQPAVVDIELIWRELPPNSLLREWAIDVTISRLSRKGAKDDVASYPSGFAQELALKLLQQTPLVAKKDFQAKLPLYVEADQDA